MKMDSEKNEIEYDRSTEQLAIYAKALGHPTRIKILKLIEKTSCCYINDLIKELPLAQSTISRHVKELKKAGLLKYKKKQTKIKYCINVSNWQIAKALFNNVFR